jgi:hypothetical protein
LECRGAARLEDLVEASAFQKAVNLEFARANGEITIPLSGLRSKPRYRALERWCAKQRPRIEPPDKTAITERLLSLAHEGQVIVDPSSVKTLKTLYGSVKTLKTLYGLIGRVLD